jgi:hypothetical protein
MKRKIVLAEVLALSVMIVASLGLAAAQITYYPILETKGNGAVWYFCTKGEDWGFNGNDVKLKSIVCTWWGAEYDKDGNIIQSYYETIKPLLVLTTKNYVILVFCPRSLPDSSVTIEGNAVDGMLKNGDLFTASGPGWTWNRVG